MTNGAKSSGIRPEAIAAGVAVTLGIAWLATRKKSKCKKLPGIYNEKGPLHINQDSYNEADRYIRLRIRDHITANAPLVPADIQLEAANELEECDQWGDAAKMSDNQKAVWKTVKFIYGRAHSAAEADSEGFLKALAESD